MWNHEQGSDALSNLKAKVLDMIYENAILSDMPFSNEEELQIEAIMKQLEQIESQVAAAKDFEELNGYYE